MTDGPETAAPTTDATSATNGGDDAYRVLARKYRPTTFADLIGQDAMVRTLSNAFATGRLAHAFVLTGVRGVGKTSTARIIARALNCIGPDGQGGPTTEPCGQCEHCRAIAQDRHVDVLEMDAASRTGVDDIRELIDGVRYRPVSARNKVYIIDEVHMLSRNAFNALLKTLEEPPEHMRFIFATTEIRKVPITVLSRCQRFDLRRIESDTLVSHFKAIAGKENASIEDEALALIVRAAEGSVRDGLSLLDQAIAHGAGTVGAAQVRDMLGLADRVRVFDLFEQVMKGDIAAALAELKDQYDSGADPVVVLQDLLELTHWLSRAKIIPSALDDVTVAEEERRRGKALSEKLAMPALARSWQMLLKGLSEVRAAPMPLSAAEMALIRLAYVSDLPSPADVVKRLQNAPDTSTATAETAPATTAPAASSASAAVSGQPPMPPPSDDPGTGGAPVRAAMGAGADVMAAQPYPEPPPIEADPRYEPVPAPTENETGGPLSDFRQVVEFVHEQREPILAANLRNETHLVAFAPGRIELRLTDHADPALPQSLSRLLSERTGDRWVVTVSGEPGEPTLREQEEAEKASRLAQVEAHPMMRAVRETFPGAEIVTVRDLGKAGDHDR